MLFHDPVTEPWYHDQALVFRSGHPVTSRPGDSPEQRVDFHGSCGESTLSPCPLARSPFAGIATGPVCLDTARAMADERDGLKPKDREALEGPCGVGVRDTGQPVAETRFKKLTKKAGSEGLAAMRAVQTDVLSEALQRSILGA